MNSEKQEKTRKKGEPGQYSPYGDILPILLVLGASILFTVFVNHIS